jgi:alkylated DNA repair dioxygenase AlkB
VKNRTLSLFPPELPEGFVYRPDFLDEVEERELLCQIERLDFQPFDFHGYIARRRIVEYGWEYDFGTRKTSVTSQVPDFLRPLRERAAEFAAVTPEALVEAVVTEYPAGAPIGWHRDVPQFEIIVGISLASACRMRLKPYKTEGKLVSIVLEPRSAYLMRGPARWNYQHSIPAVENLRYSITFRTLREKRARIDAA